MNSLGETQRKFIRQGQTVKHANPKDLKLLEHNLEELDKAYKE